MATWGRACTRGVLHVIVDFSGRERRAALPRIAHRDQHRCRTLQGLAEPGSSRASEYGLPRRYAVGRRAGTGHRIRRRCARRANVLARLFGSSRDGSVAEIAWVRPLAASPLIAMHDETRPSKYTFHCILLLLAVLAAPTQRAHAAQVPADRFQISPVRVLGQSPAYGEPGVALTRETIFYFSAPVAPISELVEAVAATGPSGSIAHTPHLSSDGKTLRVFYDSGLPPGAEIQVTLKGNHLADLAGKRIDADGDGSAGGQRTVRFSTVEVTPFPGTVLCGRVFASELAGPLNVPLVGVKVSVDGAQPSIESLTDESGNFELSPVPAGRFFVHIDGSTTTSNVPDGAYYPTVGKAWESLPGQTTNVGDVFLPLIPEGTLVPVSATADTLVTFAPDVLLNHPRTRGDGTGGSGGFAVLRQWNVGPTGRYRTGRTRSSARRATGGTRLPGRVHLPNRRRDQPRLAGSGALPQPAAGRRNGAAPGFAGGAMELRPRHWALECGGAGKGQCGWAVYRNDGPRIGCARMARDDKRRRLSASGASQEVPRTVPTRARPGSSTASPPSSASKGTRPQSDVALVRQVLCFLMPRSIHAAVTSLEHSGRRATARQRSTTAWRRSEARFRS